ncbi:exported hypothetical protein [Cupriavidus necator]|uniref:Uncharacterized protein n=1 Tax=Cupriavidus necator TaxID=106590 RepID=A0A1K0IJH3_CUPNE|nr:exported hypothetical protein [Cupriavidus necator]
MTCKTTAGCALVALVSTAAAKAECADAARRYMRELLASVESLDAIVEQHGVRTLTDLFYLQQAIIADGFVDHFPNESAIVEVVQVLPSGAHWLTFIRVEDAASAVAEPA